MCPIQREPIWQFISMETEFKPKISIDSMQSRRTISSIYHLEIYGEQMSFGLDVKHTDDHFNW